MKHCAHYYTNDLMDHNLTQILQVNYSHLLFSETSVSSKKCSEVKEKGDGVSEINLRFFYAFARQCVRSNTFCKKVLKMWLELLIL